MKPTTKYLTLIPSESIRNNRRKVLRRSWVYEASPMMQTFFLCHYDVGEEDDRNDTLYVGDSFFDERHVSIDLLKTVEYIKGVKGEWVLLCDDLAYLWMSRLNDYVASSQADVIYGANKRGAFYFIRRSILDALEDPEGDIISALKRGKVKMQELTNILHPLQYPKYSNRLAAVLGERPDKIQRLHDRRNMPHVAIITIAIGRYDRFFGGWYEAIQYYFLNECTRHYYVFTDAEELPYLDCEYCTVIKVENFGWPGNTRERFAMFLQLRQEIEANYDYVFFLQVTARLTSRLSPDEALPSMQEDGLWMTRNVDLPNGLTYDPNPRSAAYIPKGMGKIYAQGGALGGMCIPFFQMCEECVLTLQHNKDNGVGEYLNDESHMNKYILTKSPKEGWLRFWWPPDPEQVQKYNCKIYTLDKRRFGGFRALKDPKDPPKAKAAEPKKRGGGGRKKCEKGKDCACRKKRKKVE